jgi:demethylspheroidene O-methyltransferase
MARQGAWQERWLGFRNRLIESPRFQSWAADFPLTRALARRRARALFDLVAGFVYSQILDACIRLHLLDMLAERPQPIAALAARLALTDAAAERLLKAAAAIGLAERLADGRFGLGHQGAALRGNPSVLALIAHHAMLYADLADPIALLRGNGQGSRLANFWAYAGNADPAAVTAERAAAYSALMADSQARIADDILDAYSLAGHRRLLDIGGGEGVFLTAAGTRTPDLALSLFDLPAVVRRASARLGAAGLAARTTLFEGSFLTDPLPQGADVLSLVRVLHDHDDAAVLTILRKARRSVAKGGVLLVAEPMSGTPGAEPVGDAYFGFYLAAMGSGRPRTADELSGLLHQAGFCDVRLRPTRFPLVVRLIVAAA